MLESFVEELMQSRTHVLQIKGTEAREGFLFG
jgi:hypothetical protein